MRALFHVRWWLCVPVCAVATAGSADARIGTVRTVGDKTLEGDIRFDAAGNVLLYQYAGIAVTPVTIRTNDWREISFSPMLQTARTPSAVTNARLPFNWDARDIGAVKSAGVTDYKQGSYTIEAAGAGLQAEADACHFVHVPVSGDFCISAQFQRDTLVGTASVGLMVCENLKPNARRVGLLLDAGGSFVSLSRPGEEKRAPNPFRTSTVPLWLRITRVADTLSLAYSTDATRWRETMALNNLGMTGPAYVGLVASSGNESTARIVVSNVTVTRPEAPKPMVPDGITLRSGTHIAGKVVAQDTTHVKFISEIGRFNAPIYHVARIQFFQQHAAQLAKLPAGRTGVFLVNGDFLDGEIKSIANDTIKVSSVLFGLREFKIGETAVAACLRDVMADLIPFEVAAWDGSIFKAKTLTVQADAVVVNDPVNSQFRLPINFITTIKFHPAIHP